VAVPDPEAPTLQRRSVDARSVTGEFWLVFFLMYWYSLPFDPMVVSQANRSGSVRRDGCKGEELTVCHGDVAEAGNEYSECDE